MDYGTVAYNGQEIALTEQAYLTNRVFPGGWSTAEIGESYVSEWAAAGRLGAQAVLVTWQFSLMKGQEPEDAMLPWSDAPSSVADR